MLTRVPSAAQICHTLPSACTQAERHRILYSKASHPVGVLHPLDSAATASAAPEAAAPIADLPTHSGHCWLQLGRNTQARSEFDEFQNQYEAKNWSVNNTEHSGSVPLLMLICTHKPNKMCLHLLKRSHKAELIQESIWGHDS